jgi:hypothetical protein
MNWRSHLAKFVLRVSLLGRMKRWDEEKLKRVKDYLEAKPPAAFTLRDWMLVVDYLAQRYLPQDDQRTERQWRRTRRVMKRRVLFATKHPCASSEAEWKVPIRPSPYTMVLEDFSNVIAPLLIRSELWAEGSKIDLIFAATSSDYGIARDARDQLIERCHPAAWELGSALRQNYEVLRIAKSEGSTITRIIVHAKCQCLKQFDGKWAPTQELINAFETQNCELPVLPPLDAACLHSESPKICSLYLHPIPQITKPCDPEFSLWIDRALGRAPTEGNELTSDWKSLLICPKENDPEEH